MKKTILSLTLLLTLIATNSNLFPMEEEGEVPILETRGHQDINAAFLDAVQRGDLETTKGLIKQIENINVKNEKGKCALRIACENGYLYIVVLLVENEAISKSFFNEHYWLNLAIRYGHLDIAQYLDEDWKLIHTAVFQGNLKNVRSFIEEHKRDKNKKTSFGLKPIHIAALRGQLEIVKYLIEQQHVDKNEENTNGRKPIHYAARSGHLEIVKYLIEQQHVNPNEKTNNEWGGKPIHYAAQGGHLEIVKYLIEQQGVDKNEESNNEWGQKPIHYAARAGQLEIIKYLIEQQHVDKTKKPQKALSQFTPLPKTDT